MSGKALQRIVGESEATPLAPGAVGAGASEASSATAIMRALRGEDLLLLFDDEEATISQVSAVAEAALYEFVQASDDEQLWQIIAIRSPTLAVVLVDRPNAISALMRLASLSPAPSVVLLGRVDGRVLGSARRIAEAKGLRVLATAARPDSRSGFEKLLGPWLRRPIPHGRGELLQCLQGNELVLHYQPRIAFTAAGLQPCGVEAFVRWAHPTQGLLYPRQFLDSMEREGLLVELTDNVMTEAVRQSGQWHRLGLPLVLTLNLNPRLVSDPGFAERLGALLREYELPPSQITLDVVETTSAYDRELLLNVFTRLRILGVGLSLDNFGTGYSSLTELYRLPFTEVKVDGTLIREVPQEREPTIVVEAIGRLGHALGLKVCAEGVESLEALQFVRDVGFDLVQGRILSAPLEASGIEPFMRGWRSSLAKAASAAGPAAIGDLLDAPPRQRITPAS